MGRWLTQFAHSCLQHRLTIYCMLGMVLSPIKETLKKDRRKDDPKKKGKKEGFCRLEIVLASWTPPPMTEEGVGRKDELKDQTHNSLTQGPQHWCVHRMLEKRTDQVWCQTHRDSFTQSIYLTLARPNLTIIPDQLWWHLWVGAKGSFSCGRWD